MAEATRRKTALVTGATSGIGYEFAKLLAADDHDLVLVARSAHRLAAVASEMENLGSGGRRIETVAVDLARDDGPDTVFRALDEAGLAVDILINNAGYAVYGPFAETKLEDELAMMHVNTIALTALTKRVLPLMIARHSGRILNVASTAAFLPGPFMAVYYASKAYVLSFTEALAEELRESGVTVTALCPGPTETGFQQRAHLEDSKLISGREIMDAASVAKVGYEGMLHGRTVVIPGVRNKLTTEAPRILPRTLVRRLVRRSQERIGT